MSYEMQEGHQPQRPPGTPDIPPEQLEPPSAESSISGVVRLGQGLQPMPRREVPDRLVVVETCYHLPQEGEAVQVESRYSRNLSTRDQLYERRCRVGETWEPLDLGWLNGVGMIVVKNPEGEGLQTRPTPEEQAEINGRVLEIGWELESPTQYDPPPRALLFVPPGESMRVIPAVVEGLRVRCRNGSCRFVVYAWPE